MVTVRTASFVLLMLASAATVQAEDHGRMLKALRWTSVGTVAGDLSTTRAVLRQGGQERNAVLQQNTLVKAAAIDGATLGGVWTLEQRHPRIAAVLYVGVIATRGFATVHNARQIR